MSLDGRRRFLVGVGALLAAPCAYAQEPRARIGFLATGTPASSATNRKAFFDALKDKGWVEGKNLTVDVRYADGKLAQHDVLARENIMLRQFAVRIADIDRQILALDPAFVLECVEECLTIRRRRGRGAGGKESDPGARFLRVGAGSRKQGAHPDKKPPTSIQTHGNFLCNALKADPAQFSGRASG